ncbi:MAG: SDR family oxidoreductase [Acidimicrobiales bacterium]
MDDAKDSRDTDPRVAVITGGGGGIGGACARLLAGRGFTVFLVGRTSESLDAVRLAIEGASGRAVSFPADVRDWDRVQRLVEQVTTSYGRVDVLINGAGGQFHAAVNDISPRGWSAVIDTNLTGTFHMCRAMFPLLEASGGTIVNVVANVWQRAAPLMAHSGAARAGVVSLTRTLALEWAAYGIRVNALSPGITDTAGLRNYQPNLDERVARVPLQRAASAEEIADAAWFLAGPTGRYITGETLVIDGGLQLV